MDVNNENNNNENENVNFPFENENENENNNEYVTMEEEDDETENEYEDIEVEDENEKDEEKKESKDVIDELMSKKGNKKGEKENIHIEIRTDKEDDRFKNITGLLKFHLGNLLQKENIPYQFHGNPEKGENSIEKKNMHYWLITSFQLPEKITNMYETVSKKYMDVDAGRILNGCMLIFKEVENDGECVKYRSSFEEYDVIQFYVNKENDKEGRKQLFGCMENNINMDRLVEYIKTYYELKTNKNEELEIKEEGIEENKEEKINSQIFTNSILLRVDDTTKLFLKDPSKNIQLHVSKLQKLMNDFPVPKKKICENVLNILMERDTSFLMEEDRAIYNNVVVHKFGKEENLNQYSIEVSNGAYQEHQKGFEEYREKMKNKMKRNSPIEKYLMMREYKKGHHVEMNPIFNYKIEDSQYYPTYVLEDILFTLISEKTSKFRLLIPMITKVQIMNSTGEDQEEKNITKSNLYLISYLYYQNHQIFFYPLLFREEDASLKVPLDGISWNKLKKNILDNVSEFLYQNIEDSVFKNLGKYKIQYGGMISPFIPELENDEIPERLLDFLVVYFQLFYTWMNPEENPKEILKIFALNDLNDHFYIFLQFLEEICIL
jgi:hypothetical protein